MSLMRLLFSSLSVCWGDVCSPSFAPLPLPASRSTVTVSCALGSCLQMVIPFAVAFTWILKGLLLMVPEGLVLVVLGLSNILVFLAAAWEGEPKGPALSSDSLESTRHTFSRVANFFLRVAPFMPGPPSLGPSSSSSSSVLPLCLGLALRLFLMVGVGMDELTPSLWGWSMVAREAILFRAAALFPPMKRRWGKDRCALPATLLPGSPLEEASVPLSRPLPPPRPLLGLLPPGPNTGIPGGLTGDLTAGEPRVSFPGAGPLLVLGQGTKHSSGPTASLHDFLGGCVSLGLDKSLFLDIVFEASSWGCCCSPLVSGDAVGVAVDSFFGLLSWDNAVKESTVF